MWKSSFGFVKIPLPSECAAQKETEEKRKKGKKRGERRKGGKGGRERELKRRERLQIKDVKFHQLI